MKTTIKILSILFLTAFAVACSNDDDSPDPVNEEEVITTLTVTLTPQGGGTTVTMVSRDLDGDGPDAPEVTVSGPLTASTIYNGTVMFENELEDPAEDITEEIEEEDDEHQVFYSATGGIVTAFVYTDMDADGNPVGLSFTAATAGAAGMGNITVTLRHQPNKNGEGVSDGDITNAGGETDIQVTFVGVEVQ